MHVPKILTVVALAGCSASHRQGELEQALSGGNQHAQEIFEAELAKASAIVTAGIASIDSHIYNAKMDDDPSDNMIYLTYPKDFLSLQERDDLPLGLEKPIWPEISDEITPAMAVTFVPFGGRKETTAIRVWDAGRNNRPEKVSTITPSKQEMETNGWIYYFKGTFSWSNLCRPCETPDVNYTYIQVRAEQWQEGGAHYSQRVAELERVTTDCSGGEEGHPRGPYTTYVVKLAKGDVWIPHPDEVIYPIAMEEYDGDGDMRRTGDPGYGDLYALTTGKGPRHHVKANAGDSMDATFSAIQSEIDLVVERVRTMEAQRPRGRVQ